MIVGWTAWRTKGQFDREEVGSGAAEGATEDQGV